MHPTGPDLLDDIRFMIEVDTDTDPTNGLLLISGSASMTGRGHGTGGMG